MQRLQRAVLRGSRGIGLRHATKCWSLNDICRVRFKLAQSVIPRLFTGFTHRLGKWCIFQLGLLALKENGNGVVGILTRHVHYIGWCIVR